ncbi:radical SAM protein [Candidatus Dependentiae bacterium]|nr:radical SAM protein [Candidatus Dependentiae bacterium]
MLKLLLKSGIETVKANILKKYKYPIGVYLSLTTRCNLKCKYCDFDQLNNAAEEEFPTEDVLSLVDEMYMAGVKKINLTGGEPLLHSGFKKIIDHIKSKNIFTVVSTNALLAKYHLESLKKSDAVMVSFDGRKDNHEIMRGKNTYNKVVDAMNFLKDNSINFWTTTTLNKNNIDDIEFIVENAERLKSYANFVLIQFFNNPIEINSLPDYERIKDFIPEHNQIKDAFKKLIFLKKQGRKIGSTLEFLEFMYNWNDYNILYSNNLANYKCFAGKLYCHIYYDHLMFACGQCRGTVPGLDYRNEGFIKTFKKLEKIKNCNSCRVACDSENNLIYSLNLKVILNWLRKIKK